MPLFVHTTSTSTLPVIYPEYRLVVCRYRLLLSAVCYLPLRTRHNSTIVRDQRDKKRKKREARILVNQQAKKTNDDDVGVTWQTVLYCTLLSVVRRRFARATKRRLTTWTNIWIPPSARPPLPIAGGGRSVSGPQKCLAAVGATRASTRQASTRSEKQAPSPQGLSKYTTGTVARESRLRASSFELPISHHSFIHSSFRSFCHHIPVATMDASTVWAIRNCESLQSPAIFTNYQDCVFHIEQAKDDESNGIEYQSFTNLLDAMNYILPATQLETRVNTSVRAVQMAAATTATTTTTLAAAYSRTPLLVPPPTAAAAAAATAQTATPRSAGATTTVVHRTNTSAGWGLAARQPAPAPANAAAAAAAMATSNAPTAATNSTPTPSSSAPRKRGRPPKAAQSPNTNAADTNGGTSSPPPRKKSKTKQPLSTRWDDKFEKLKAYKSLHGTCDIPYSVFKTDRSFYEWVQREKVRIQRILKLKLELREQQQQQQQELAPQGREGEASISSNTVKKNIQIPEREAMRVDKLLELGLTPVQAALDPERNERRTPKWEERFLQLQQYKNEHGTLDVSFESNLRLRRWVMYQSRLLADYEKDPASSNLKEGQRDRLLELGVQPTEKKIKGPAPDWDAMYGQLVQFHETHGNVEVPVRPSQPVEHWSRDLYNWTIRVRENFGKFKKGEKISEKSTARINPDRIRLLTKLGFRFSIIHRQKFDYRAAEWLEHYTKYGKEPPRDHPDGHLITWAAKVRRQYWERKEDEANYKGPLSQKRIDKLTAWGFDFKEPTGIKVTGERKTWEERFQELLQFKEEHGSVDVPQQYPGLGTWVHHQRRHYRHLKKGEKSPMAKEKIERLVSVGFKWITRKSPTRPLGNQGNGTLDFARYEKNQPEGAVAASGGATVVGRPKGGDNDDSSSEDEEEDDESSADDYRFYPSNNRPSPRGNRVNNVYHQPAATQPLPTQQQQQYATLPPAQQQPQYESEQWGGDRFRGMWNSGRFV